MTNTDINRVGATANAPTPVEDPANEDREALARAIYSKIAFQGGDEEHYEAMREAIYHEAADAVIGLGFHRTVQSEPTDAMVFAAMKEFTRTETAGRLRAMRAALRAALGAA